MPTALRIPAWTRVAILFGFIKLGGVLAGRLILHGGLPAGQPFGLPPLLNYLLLAAFGGAAIFLVVAGHGDARAVWLGGFFLFMADAFCARPTALLELHGAGMLADVGRSLDSLRLDVLMPLFLWRFVHDFPQPPAAMRLRRLVDLGVRTSAFTALAFLTFYLVDAVLLAIAGEPVAARAAVAGAPDLMGIRGDKPLEGLYGAIVFSLVALALPVLAYKSRLASGEGRRQARHLGNALVLGLGPVAAYQLGELFVPGAVPYLAAHPEISRPLTVTAGLFALWTPASTCYFVLVHRALDVRLTARRALQYALARSSVITLATAPLALVVFYCYENRSQSVSRLFSGSRMLILLSVAALGMAALSYRRGLLDWIDRRFFREQYDARQILSMLVERVRAIREGADLAKLISREVDFALHLSTITLMILDPRTGMLKDPNDRARRLDASSQLAGLVSSGSEALLNEPEADTRSPIARLPEKERLWLADSGFRLLVPILARDGSLLGIICLGDKKSGLPFLKEDRQLLHGIASSAAWVLELEHSRTATPRTAGTRLPALESLLPAEALPVTEVAKECLTCGTLYQPYTVFCGTCSRRLDPAHVPFVLPGRFRFERRVGAGGMGVVYRGADLALGRPVAVKTLRRVSPDDAMRLRREARTAAAVSHPHLASIYGIETWQGTPMLILELLEGGTLAERIDNRRLPPLAVVDLGIAIAEALEQLHSADILHRDVKPSNIGFNRAQVPKLMDFGIARVMFDLRRDGRPEAAGSADDLETSLPPTSILDQTATSLDLSRQFAGTLSYLSPEALNGQRADASFDLWSLAIVLYECLLGSKVFSGGDLRQITSRIRLGRVPDFAQVCPEYDPVLADFFRRALHKTVARRPATALELKRMLTEVRGKLAS